METWRALLCRIFGHRDETRYMFGNPKVPYTHCRRCGSVRGDPNTWSALAQGTLSTNPIMRME